MILGCNTGRVGPPPSEVPATSALWAYCVALPIGGFRVAIWYLNGVPKLQDGRANLNARTEKYCMNTGYFCLWAVQESNLQPWA